MHWRLDPSKLPPGLFVPDTMTGNLRVQVPAFANIADDTVGGRARGAGGSDVALIHERHDGSLAMSTYIELDNLKVSARAPAARVRMAHYRCAAS